MFEVWGPSGGDLLPSLRHGVPWSTFAARMGARVATSRAFLPTTREEMAARGWDQLDILIINGDAYVDHPAFGGALIGRFLEGRGFRVGIDLAAALGLTRGPAA